MRSKLLKFQDWSDLIEYVIHKFINVPRQPTTNNNNNNNNSSRSVPQPHTLQSSVSFEKPLEKEEWSEEDIDALYWYYIQSRKCEDVTGNILKLYCENGISNKTRTGIIQQLFDQNLINQAYFDDYMKNENINKCDDRNNCSNNDRDEEFYDIKLLKEQLVRDNKGKAILWLQRLLLEACYCKVVISNEDIYQDDFIAEFVPYCFAKLNQSIPIVAWSKEQNTVVNNEVFMLLLHKLGFHLPADTRKLFVRIPNFWTADHIYSVAQKLGPIDPATLNFDVNLLQNADLVECNKANLDVRLPENKTGKSQATFVQYTDLLNTSTNWYEAVTSSKMSSGIDVSQEVTSDSAFSDKPGSVPVVETEMAAPAPTPDPDAAAKPVRCSDDFERNSICETASVTSDLTRMYVSDEEDKN